jgi:type I restriction enzyme S subunit
MKAAELLAMYERVADAPAAVGKLRLLVLDLAIRGKLVSQNETDEPAEALLNQIATEKAALPRRSRGKAATVETARFDIPFALPPGWRWSCLHEAGVLSPRNEAADDCLAAFVPMALVSADYGTENEHAVKPWKDIKSGYSHFAEGDVGLAKITPCFENRKSTIFRNLTGGFGSGTTELHVLRPILVDPSYILIFLKSPFFIDGGVPRMTGTAGQKRIPVEYFAKSPFPLPPLAEQHRIVAKVDELMALCDQLEAARREREAARDRLAAASLVRLNAPDPDTFQADARFALNVLPALSTRPDQVKQLRQTILNLAVRGKLVPQDPEDPSATSLLEGLGTGWSAKSSQAGDLEAALPTGWAPTLVEDCCIVTGGIQKTPMRSPRNNAYPYVGVANVQRGRLDLSEVKSFELVEGELSRYRLAENDVLIVEGNGSPTEIGRCAVWRGEIAECVHQNHLIRCRPINHELTRYVALYLNSPDGMREMRRLAITSAGLYSLSVGKIRKIRVPLPPLPEQHRIVDRVDALMALCDLLESSLAVTETSQSGLLDTLLRQALEPVAPQAT